MSQFSLLTGFFEGMRENILHVFWAKETISLLSSAQKSLVQLNNFEQQCTVCKEGRRKRDMMNNVHRTTPNWTLYQKMSITKNVLLNWYS